MRRGISQRGGGANKTTNSKGARLSGRNRTKKGGEGKTTSTASNPGACNRHAIHMYLKGAMVTRRIVGSAALRFKQDRSSI